MKENLYEPGCVRTFSGRYLNVKDPDTIDIYPIDLATQLSRKCRFGGATKKFYSVAEHSVWCALKAEELYPDETKLPLKLLLHDGHEYILEDIGSPIKSNLIGYGSLATRLQNAIDVRFGAFLSNTDRIRKELIDRMALEWEWENKVLSWQGLYLEEEARIEYFLHYFKKYCKQPFVLKP